jgi:hypothetical protein
MPSVDEKLLAQDQGSADRAGDFREAKQSNKNENPEDDVSFNNAKDFIKDPEAYVNDDVSEANQRLLRASFFNQARQRAKRKRGESVADKDLSKISQAKIALAQILRGAWISLIKSFGLTLIWINIHWLLSQVFPQLFCKLGEEWFLRPGAQSDPIKRKIVKRSGKKINLVETMGCGCLNLVVFIVIIFILAIFLWPIAVVDGIIDLGRKILEAFKLL